MVAGCHDECFGWTGRWVMGDCRRRRTRRGLNGDRGEEEGEEEESAGGFRAPRVRNFKLRSPRGVAPTLVHRRRKKIEDGEVDRGNGRWGRGGGGDLYGSRSTQKTPIARSYVQDIIGHGGWENCSFVRRSDGVGGCPVMSYSLLLTLPSLALRLSLYPARFLQFPPFPALPPPRFSRSGSLPSWRCSIEIQFPPTHPLSPTYLPSAPSLFHLLLLLLYISYNPSSTPLPFGRSSALGKGSHRLHSAR